MKRLIAQIAAGIAGLLIATIAVPGVEFNGNIKTLILAGFILGLLNFFIKPILKGITFPIRIITLNLFTIAISMAMVWIIDFVFPEITIAREASVKGFLPLFWTTAIVWLLSTIFSSLLNNKKTDKNKK